MQRMLENRQIDSRQLRVLLALLEERSVTRAAQILGQSQPYVSLVLRRLRDLVGDPILVRSGSKMVLTERGRKMMEPARAALSGIEQIVSDPQVFDPRTADGAFRVASADCMEAFVLPPLVERLRTAAPAAHVVIRSVDQSYDYAGALERDELDVVISNSSAAPKHLKTATLMNEDIVCLFAHGHPFASKSRIGIEDYLAAEHVAPVARSRADPGPIDSSLAERGLRRDIRVMVPEFNLIPYILLSSSLVFTSSRHFADHFCAMLPLTSLPAPEECGRLRFFLLWHERVHATGRNIWLRNQVMAVARDLTNADIRKPI